MRFEIDWHDTSDGVPCTTLASIALLIDGTPIWPVTDGEVSDFEWFANELLAHITECWKPLVLKTNLSDNGPARTALLFDGRANQAMVRIARRCCGKRTAGDYCL